MGKDTGISWTNHTFNPWWGCTKVSAGCDLCYAEGQSKRYGHDIWGNKARRRFFGEKHWNEPLRWNRESDPNNPSKVFCASMADVFEELHKGHPDREKMAEERERLFQLIAQTPNLIWLLLTKRPQAILRTVGGPTMSLYPNVWIGTSVEDDRVAERIDRLREVPATLRFLSIEPMIGPVTAKMDGIGWGIIGGESGKRRRIDPVVINLLRKGEYPGGFEALRDEFEKTGAARPFGPGWAEDAIHNLRKSGAAVFVKQMGTNPIGLEISDYKGEKQEEWPETLRVQEFPKFQLTAAVQ
jgi:protein gp37